MTIKKQVGLHGKRAFVTEHDQVVARNAFVTGGVDKPAIVLPGSPDTVAIFDDFIGDTGRSLRAGTDPHWRVLDGDTGNDTGANVHLIPGTNGVLRMILSSSNSHSGASSPETAVTNGMGIIGGALNWKGNQGSIPTGDKNGLRFGCRLRASGYTDTGRSINIWAGFTDSVALEAPIYDTGGVLQATADDAVGFGYSAGGDTGWSGFSVNGGGTPQQVHLDNTRQALRAGAGSTDNSNVYDVLELDIHHGISDTGGTVSFYVNGQAKGSIPAPIAMNVGLTPSIYMWGDTGGGQITDVDWVNISAPRDTGA